MKKYIVARYFWVTLSFAAFTVINILYGILHYANHKEYGVFIAWMILAILCGVGAVILFLRGQGITRYDAKPFEESKEYIHLARGANYALKQELIRREKNVKRLEEEQRNVLKWVAIGLPVGTIGGTVFSIASQGVNLSDMASVYQSYTGLTYPFLLVGAVMLVAGVRFIFYGFINSDSQMAYWLSEKFTLDTYSVKISRENILIGVLNQRIEKERIEEQRRKEQYQKEEREQMEKVFVTISDQMDMRG
jgi:hypothetical protein